MQHILLEQKASKPSLSCIFQMGISGPVWYAISAIMPTVLLAIPLIRFRMIAPGARTFLHVIYGRFGRTAHILLCAFALMNSLSIIAGAIDSRFSYSWLFLGPQTITRSSIIERSIILIEERYRKAISLQTQTYFDSVEQSKLRKTCVVSLVGSS